MRILYVYREYRDRRRAYGSMMEHCGHKVLYHKAVKRKHDSLEPKHIQKARPDIIWLLNPFYAANCETALRYARNKGIPIVVYGTLDPQTEWTEWLPVWRLIDFLFVHHKGLHEYLKSQSFNSFYMPIGYYPDQYPHRRVRKTIDLSFCGGTRHSMDPLTDRRCQYLQSLESRKVKVYGGVFMKKLHGIEVHKYKTHEEQNKVYSRTKVNLDFPFLDTGVEFYHRKYHIKNRFFEIPASGNFLLTVRCPEFLDIFGEHAVGYYDDNIESLHESIDRYVTDKRIRQKMAAKAYQIVKSKHKFIHRFKTMFKILKENL